MNTSIIHLNRMKFGLIAMALIALCVTTPELKAGVNVLIIGSSSDSNFAGKKSTAFAPSEIRNQLNSILSGAGLGAVNVTLIDRANDGGYATYSLAEWFHYPFPAGVETTSRWPKLRGEAGTVWDYVILIGDPYTMEYMPGLYAHGVANIANEVAKGKAATGRGETILLMPWPGSTSLVNVNHYKELVYRAGRTGGYKVAPAGLAWQADGSSSTVTPLSARGAYICAASIYSTIWGQSADQSTYKYNKPLADAVHSTVTTANAATQYTGSKMNFQSPFLMLGDKRRAVNYSHKGTSTENHFTSSSADAMNRCRISYDSASYVGKYSNDTPEDDGQGWPTWKPMPIAWNHGRKFSEVEKEYVVNPNYWQLGMGFMYQSNTWSDTIDGANDTHIGQMYSKDLYLADYMRTQDGSARIIPVRFLWAQIHKEYPALNPLSDGSGPHLNGHLTQAVGNYMYTLYSGRCPLDPMPSPMTSEWFAQKIGYETAWRAGNCSSRAPGFKVMPSAASALTVTPSTKETMTVRFIFPPQSDVTVTVSSSDASAGIVGPQQLLFTPTNYNVPQSVTVAGVAGSPASAPFNVVYSTTSDDPAYDGLSDSWEYGCVRTDTPLTYVNNGTIQYSTPKNFPVTINLGTSGAGAGNTVFAGPNRGTLSWSGSDVVYTPNANYFGPDGFAYSSRVAGTVTTGYIAIDVINGYPDGAVRAEATDASAAETNQATGTFSIIRTGSTTDSLSVNFTLGGTATAGSDYNLNASSPITIPAGQSSVSVILTPIDDNVFGEHVETASLTVTAGSGYTAISNPATISIADNDNNMPAVDAGPPQTLTMAPALAQPGLYYGVVSSADIDKTTANPKTLLITNVAAYTEDAIAPNATEIYTGQIYDADGVISFTENIDDDALIIINGVTVVDNGSYNTRTNSGTLNVNAGWNDIEIRIANAGGGSGPNSGIGIGYDPAGGAAWQTLVDPGDGSLLRVVTPGSAVANLDGTVTDSEDTPFTTWTVTGTIPAGLPVAFGKSNDIDTTATFLAAGTYTLRLTADDGYGPVHDEVIITVNPAVSYALTVTGGTGDGNYYPGTQVSIEADAPQAGYRFVGWTTSGGGTFADASSRSTTYTMPNNPVELTANYGLNNLPLVDAGPDQNVPKGTAGPIQLMTSPTDAIQGFMSTTVGGNSTDGANWPSAAEGPGMAIDGNTGTKYLNYGKAGSGFYITPATGAMTLTGIKVYTANDSADRDPITISIEGANGGNLSLGSSWTLIQDNVNLGINTDPGRLKAGPLVMVATSTAYTSYRIIVRSIRNDTTANSVQYSGLELHGYTGTGTTVNLAGSATDAVDGDTVTAQWTFVSSIPGGLAAPTILDASLPVTTAIFTGDNGVYTLRLTGDDGYTSVSDDVSIVVGPPISKYALTVTGGTGDGSYYPGTVVAIAANAPAAGYSFVGWTASGGGSFANANAASTTYTMPGNAAEVTANYVSNAPPLVNSGPDQVVSLVATTNDWTPAVITTIAWYDASDAGTLWADTNGTIPATRSVARWSDKSGKANHLVQSTVGKEPTTGIRTLNTLNPLNVIDFDGTEHLTKNPLSIPTSDNIAMFGVMIVDTPIQATGACLWGMNSTPNNDYQFAANNTTNFTGLIDGNSGIGTDLALTGGPFNGPSIYNLNFNAAASNKSVYVDGISRGSNGFTQIDNSMQFCLMANRVGAAGTEINGAVAEWIATEDVTAEVRQKFEGYLAHKWGIQGNLPTGHPYKSAKPLAPQMPATVNLDGTVTDADGNAVTTNWTVVSSAPAGLESTVTFANASAIDTTASFTVAGTYTLRLTASDSLSSSSDDVVITVLSPTASYNTWAGRTFANPFSLVGVTHDPDGDGQKNLMEFAFGTDPTASDQGPLAINGSVNGSPIPVNAGGGAFEFYFVRRKDHGTSGSVSYTAQFSSDLGVFYNSAATPAFVANSSKDPAYEVVKVAYPTTLPNGQKASFARIMLNIVP